MTPSELAQLLYFLALFFKTYQPRYVDSEDAIALMAGLRLLIRQEEAACRG